MKIIEEFLDKNNAELKHISEFTEDQQRYVESDGHERLKASFEAHVREYTPDFLEGLYRSSRFQRGEYGRIKNTGLYVDVGKSGELISSPASISRDDASEIIEQAKRALHIANS